ncbi:MAG: hypothetical protein H0V36_04470 [Chloroflexi bacterium]|nr:hypothetical protein [Chloroflexota bacterium]
MRMMLLVAALAVGLVGGAAPASATRIGNEGCTPGYWKQAQHFDSWEEYSPSTTLASVFTLPAYFASSEYGDDTFLEALNYGGGSGLTSKARQLLRAAVAAFLNAASEDVGYPYRRFSDPGNMLASVNSALASQNQTTITNLKDDLDAKNNLGCPLD